MPLMLRRSPETARTRPQTLRDIRVDYEQNAKLAMLASADEDPAAYSTAASNRLSRLLTQIHPVLERAPGPGITHSKRSGSAGPLRDLDAAEYCWPRVCMRSTAQAGIRLAVLPGRGYLCRPGSGDRDCGTCRGRGHGSADPGHSSHPSTRQAQCQVKSWWRSTGFTRC